MPAETVGRTSSRRGKVEEDVADDSDGDVDEDGEEGEDETTVVKEPVPRMAGRTRGVVRRARRAEVRS